VTRSISAFVLGIALASPAFGEQGRAGFTVAVIVPVHVSLDVLDQPSVLTLTAQDVARGYKDVSARYRVRHNDRNGYQLEFSSFDPLVRRVEVRGFDAEVVVSDGVVAIRRPGAAFEQDLALEFHFVLAPSTPPGMFELPLRVVASPI